MDTSPTLHACEQNSMEHTEVRWKIQRIFIFLIVLLTHYNLWIFWQILKGLDRILLVTFIHFYPRLKSIVQMFGEQSKSVLAVFKDSRQLILKGIYLFSVFIITINVS